MILRAGKQIRNGKFYYWTNWYLDQLYLGEPMYNNPDSLVIDEWLHEMFDDKHSAFLMPMPKENWN